MDPLTGGWHVSPVELIKSFLSFTLNVRGPVAAPAGVEVADATVGTALLTAVASGNGKALAMIVLGAVTGCSLTMSSGSTVSDSNFLFFDSFCDSSYSKKQLISFEDPIGFGSI